MRGRDGPQRGRLCCRDDNRVRSSSLPAGLFRSCCATCGVRFGLGLLGAATGCSPLSVSLMPAAAGPAHPLIHSGLLLLLDFLCLVNAARE